MALFDESDLPAAVSTPVSGDVEQQPTRRTFLKAVGATFLGSVGGTAPISRTLRTAAAAPLPPEAIAAIVTASPLFQEVLGELQVYNIGFDVTPTNFHPTSDQGNLVGMRLQHHQAPSPRTGADLILTVDRQASLLVAVQYLIGWCLASSLEIHCTLLDQRRGEYEQPCPKQRPLTAPPIMHRPRLERHWTFPLNHTRPSQPEQVPATGWPPDDPSRRFWQYQGGSGIEWATVHGLAVQRATQVQAQRSNQPDEQRVVNLDFTDFESDLPRLLPQK